jgi:hypothetical protein
MSVIRSLKTTPLCIHKNVLFVDLKAQEILFSISLVRSEYSISSIKGRSRPRAESIHIFTRFSTFQHFQISPWSRLAHQTTVDVQRIDSSAPRHVPLHDKM